MNVHPHFHEAGHDALDLFLRRPLFHHHNHGIRTLSHVLSALIQAHVPNTLTFLTFLF